jgi:hypothetical protein
MPNWATNIVNINGDSAILDEIANKLSTPYETRHAHPTGGETEPTQVTGDFLMWNIIRPDDLDTYFTVPQKPNLGDSLEESMQNAMRELHESNHWYPWNTRNWGTKWEIGSAEVTKTDNSLVYRFDSAWTPPVEAVAELAKQYPQVSISIKFIEEGMGFAGEVFFENGEYQSDVDYQINHATMLDFDDFCWVCGFGTDEYGTPDKELDEEAVKAYGCFEYKADIDELTNKLGGK